MDNTIKRDREIVLKDYLKNKKSEGLQFYDLNMYAPDNTPETIITKTVTCDHLHDYHAIGLDIVSADAIMTAWNFSEIDKQWYDITYKGLQLTSEAEAEKAAEATT